MASCLSTMHKCVCVAKEFCRKLYLNGSCGTFWLTASGQFFVVLFIRRASSGVTATQVQKFMTHLGRSRWTWRHLMVTRPTRPERAVGVDAPSCSLLNIWSFAVDTRVLHRAVTNSVMCCLRTTGVLGRLLHCPRAGSLGSGFTFRRQPLALLDGISHVFLRESGLWETSFPQRVTSSPSLWST